MNSKILRLLVAGVIAGPIAAHAQTYTATELSLPGSSPGNTSVVSFAAAINNNGQVAGFGTTSSGVFDGFLYSNGTMTDLGSFLPAAINNSGAMAGKEEFAGQVLAATYINGTVTSLGTLGSAPGGLPGTTVNYSSAAGINDRGQIIGLSSAPSGSESFVYSTATGIMTAIPCSSNTCLGVSGINNAGQIAGTLYIPNTIPPGGVYENAAVYSNGTVRNLGTLTGSSQFPQNDSSAVAINNSGQVAGSSYNAANNSEAFLYSNGTMIDLGGGEVDGMNDLGKVVGASGPPGSPGDATLWSDGTSINLNSVLSQPLPAGFTLNQAVGINDSGVIVAEGANASGLEASFLLTPNSVPEIDAGSAAGALLLLFGSLAVIRGRSGTSTLERSDRFAERHKASLRNGE